MDGRKHGRDERGCPPGCRPIELDVAPGNGDMLTFMLGDVALLVPRDAAKAFHAKLGATIGMTGPPVLGVERRGDMARLRVGGLEVSIRPEDARALAQSILTVVGEVEGTVYLLSKLSGAKP